MFINEWNEALAYNLGQVASYDLGHVAKVSYIYDIICGLKAKLQWSELCIKVFYCSRFNLTFYFKSNNFQFKADISNVNVIGVFNSIYPIYHIILALLGKAGFYV